MQGPVGDPVAGLLLRQMDQAWLDGTGGSPPFTADELLHAVDACLAHLDSCDCPAIAGRHQAHVGGLSTPAVRRLLIDLGMMPPTVEEAQVAERVWAAKVDECRRLEARLAGGRHD